jgi:hypothetical protein
VRPSVGRGDNKCLIPQNKFSPEKSELRLILFVHSPRCLKAPGWRHRNQFAFSFYSDDLGVELTSASAKALCADSGMSVQVATRATLLEPRRESDGYRDGRGACCFVHTGRRRFHERLAHVTIMSKREVTMEMISIGSNDLDGAPLVFASASNG